MQFVASQGSSVAERLAIVLFLEVRQFSDDLRRRHSVCDEVDDMRDRDPQAADCSAPREDIRILCEAIGRAFHSLSQRQ